VRQQPLNPRPLRVSQRHTQTNEQKIQTKLPSPMNSTNAGQSHQMDGDLRHVRAQMLHILLAVSSSIVAAGSGMT
ncbi:hypothetical protein ACWEIM_25085, partial [Streptomyces sp. NPDC004778]